MGEHRYEATAWELEAARRREVVKTDFDAAARGRGRSSGVVAGGTYGLIDRLTSWVSRVLRGVPTTMIDGSDEDPCPPPVRTLKPGC